MWQMSKDVPVAGVGVASVLMRAARPPDPTAMVAPKPVATSVALPDPTAMMAPKPVATSVALRTPRRRWLRSRRRRQWFFRSPRR
jgi:hypothetical protein